MRLLVVGAGGHAKVVTDTARAAGWEIAGVIGLRSGAETLLGYPVSRELDDIKADAFIVAVGNNRTRRELFENYRSRGIRPAIVIHPSAIIGSDVDIGEGTFIAAGAMVNVNATIGEDVILNTGCVVEHDVLVGDHVLIGPNASLCGESAVGIGTTLGAGASVIPTATVGEWSVCGAGAVVVSDLPSHALCVGVPARPVRSLEE